MSRNGHKKAGSKIPDNVTVSGLEEFVQNVVGFRANNREDIILFRGQKDSRHLLLPKIGRPDAVKGRDQLELRERERLMFDSFKRHSLPYVRITPQADLDWLALAQHHGLPTRLLDWTANALAALWFVVREPTEHFRSTSAHGVVWVLNPADEDFLTPEEELECEVFKVRSVSVFRPKHVGERIIAQAGYFTLHPLDSSTCRFKPFDADPNFGGGLRKILIPHSAFSELRDQLARLGVSALTMFPGLDGVCDYLWWNNRLFRDELDRDNVSLNQPV